MSDLKRSTLTPDESKRRLNRALTLGGTLFLGGAAAAFYLLKPTQNVAPPTQPIVNTASTLLYPTTHLPEHEQPKSLGDIIISPPELDMGQITVGQGHYTGSFIVKVIGTAANITKVEFPFAQQAGLKIDTSSCPPDAPIDADQSCPISFVYDPPYPGRIDAQISIQAQLHLSNSTNRLQTVSVHITGEAVKPVAPPVIPAITASLATDTDGYSDDALSYLRRRQRPGQLDRQFDPASYTYETAQNPKQDNWRSLGYGPNLSSMPVDMTRVVTMDKPIPAVIKMTIDSRHPSRAVATVERDIYGGDGRLVIIERGSTLIGSAASLSNPSEEKVAINWERIIRPDGSAWTFAATSGDAMGRSGAIGIIDQRWIDRFGVTLAVSAITSGLNIALNASQTTTIGVGGTSTTTTTPAYTAMQQFQGDFRSIFSQFAKEQLAIPPIITIPAGTRITVFPTTDLWLRPVNPTDDMRLAYARQNRTSDAYLSGQAKATAATASINAADRRDTSQQTKSQQQPYIQNAADANGISPRSNVPIAPITPPGPTQDPYLATDSVTTNGQGQASFQSGKVSSDILKATTTVTTSTNPMNGAYGGNTGYPIAPNQYGTSGAAGYQSPAAAPSWAGATPPAQ